ncbi:hypothetical protein [Pseudomonas sp.]|uniref:hypothetical protein n=1 Tax=Pseudomonas sp. TaxID=306 RepID=UPI003CC5E7D8
MKYSIGEKMLIGLTTAGVINCIALLYFSYFKLKTLEAALKPFGITTHRILNGKDPISRINRLASLATPLILPTAENTEGRISRADIKKIPTGLLLSIKALYLSLTINFGLFFVHWAIYRNTLYSN